MESALSTTPVAEPRVVTRAAPAVVRVLAVIVTAEALPSSRFPSYHWVPKRP